MATNLLKNNFARFKSNLTRLLLLTIYEIYKTSTDTVQSRAK